MVEKPVIASSLEEFFEQEDQKAEQGSQNNVPGDDKLRDEVIDNLFGPKKEKIIKTKNGGVVNKNAIVADLKKLLRKYGFNPRGRTENMIISTFVQNIRHLKPAIKKTK